MMTITPPMALRDVLAPSGALRAAINLSNTLLVSGRSNDGSPVGVAPDVARAVADELGARLSHIPYRTPAEIVDAASRDEWDIALIGDEHAREGVLSFTRPYALIEATYLVRGQLKGNAAKDLDRVGMRIAAPRRTAYGLWLEKNLKKATLVLADGISEARVLLAREEVDALAGLRPWLERDEHSMPGVEVASGSFAAVQQSIGFRPYVPGAAEFLGAFVEAARRSRLVDRLV